MQRTQRGSRSAGGRRLGFTFEGIFCQATIVKGRNRDTAWFSILDGEWPAIRGTFERWLAPRTSTSRAGSATRWRPSAADNGHLTGTIGTSTGL